MDKSTSKRTPEQNRLMWSLLTDLSNQLMWPVDGEMVKLDQESWKIICTAGIKRYQRIAKGIDGGFVMLGASTSRMSKSEMSDLCDFILAFGTDKGVKWTEPKL